MKPTTHGALRAAARAPGAALVSRSRLLAALIAATLALGLCGQLPGDATAAASGGPPADLRVGHTVKHLSVPGSAQGENRAVDVHLWYPADKRAFSDAPRTEYTSRLYGRKLIPGLWDPLAWKVEAEIAGETDAIDQHGKPFPVIVFSHGSTNDPIDYAHTLELIAGAGFVVAAPYHINNAQDDVRIDYINQKAGTRLFDCRDGLAPRPDVGPGDCSKTNVPFNMADRVRDISYVLDHLSEWFGDRVDVSRAGVLGHSRGTVTALAAAGGSASWSAELNCVRPRPAGDDPRCWPGVVPEPGVKAVMGMAIGVSALTRGANLGNVRVPALLVAGALDQTSPRAVSQSAFDQISSTEKAFVLIENATHRSFDSTYCAQTQAAGAIAQSNPESAILDRQTFDQIATHATSGRPTEYCAFSTFTDPVDIRPLVATATGFDVTADNVPSTGLETDEVKQGMTELAVTFFGTVLKRTGNDGPHFTRYLAPKWLEKRVPMVGDAAAFAGADAICPPGQEVVCED